MSAMENDGVTVTRVEKIDYAKNTFDGKKADLFINTGKFGGKHFLINVKGGDGRPTLIAVHL